MLAVQLLAKISKLCFLQPDADGGYILRLDR